MREVRIAPVVEVNSSGWVDIVNVRVSKKNLVCSATYAVLQRNEYKHLLTCWMRKAGLYFTYRCCLISVPFLVKLPASFLRNKQLGPLIFVMNERYHPWTRGPVDPLRHHGIFNKCINASIRYISCSMPRQKVARYSRWRACSVPIQARDLSTIQNI